MKTKTILTHKEIKKIIATLAKKIVKKFTNINNIALVGIHTNGVYIAQRIAKEIKKIVKKDIPLGTLDITFYRDDIGYRNKIRYAKDTNINFDINNKNIVLVDDVLYTGRTIRAAMEQLLDLGRPQTISVAVLVDRGLRELPIYAEFVGKKVRTTHEQQIELLLKEVGAKDIVVIYDKKNE